MSWNIAARVALVFALVVALPPASGCEERHKRQKLKFSAKVVDSGKTDKIVIEYKASHPVAVDVDGVKKGFFKRKKGKRIHIEHEGLKPGKNTITLRASSQFGKAKVKLEVERKAAPKVKVTFKSKPGPGEVRVSCSAYSLKVAAVSIAVPTATGKATVHLKSPPGTKIKFLGKSWTSAAGKETWTVVVDVFKGVWDLRPRKLYKHDPKYPIQVTSPDGRTVRTKFSFMTGIAMTRAFRESASKPLLAPGEKISDPHRGVLVLEQRGKRVQALGWLGKATKLREYTLVALITKGKRRTKHCGSYRGSKSGKTQKISNDALDSVVTVIDRRTGKQVKKKTFKAKMPRCPKSTKYGGSTGRVSKRKMLRWALKLAK